MTQPKTPSFLTHSPRTGRRHDTRGVVYCRCCEVPIGKCYRFSGLLERLDTQINSGLRELRRVVTHTPARSRRLTAHTIN